VHSSMHVSLCVTGWVVRCCQSPSSHRLLTCTIGAQGLATLSHKEDWILVKDSQLALQRITSMRRKLHERYVVDVSTALARRS
jgi:hypothetical protein